MQRVTKSDVLKKVWHIAYTSPQSERKAKRKLDAIGIKSFLPMQSVLRQWSDRKKKVEVPLFPNYIFINVNSFERYDVIKIPELVCYISFEGQVAVVADSLIESLEKVIAGGVEISNENFTKIGSKVRITHGKFAGAEGVLLRKNGKIRLVVSIEVLKRSVSVDISAECVEAVY